MMASASGGSGFERSPAQAARSPRDCSKRSSSAVCSWAPVNPGDGGIASGEKKTGAWGFGQEGVDVALLPDIVDNDQCRLLRQRSLVLIDAGRLGVITLQLVSERLGYFAKGGDQIVFRFPAHGDPDDAVREGLLHNFAARERLGQHRLADSAAKEDYLRTIGIRLPRIPNGLVLKDPEGFVRQVREQIAAARARAGAR